jgi:hypothetical protein
MSGHRSNRRGLKRKKDTVTRRKLSEKTEHCNDLIDKEAYFEIFVISVLFAFGVYHSILYFGHRVVPNPDFTAFVRVGHELLSFQLPGTYKRAPVLGLLQAGLSYLAGGQHPDLTAGWLLNAILHPFNVVLLWLVGKRIVGRSALWIAIIAIINPWLIELLTNPIAETTLLFFVLLTFYFIFKRSSWCYLFASITTMVRYEGAALILAAFVMDMITCENKAGRIRAFVYTAVATVPLAMWMLGTVMSWQGAGSTHYLKELGVIGAVKETFMRYMGLIWRVGFYPLFIPGPAASKDTVVVLSNLSKILVVVSFLFGAVYGLCKRRWNILVLLIFFVPYIIVHVLHSFIYSRFCTTIHWIVMLICLYGLQSSWELINKNNRVPKIIIFVLQGAVLITAFVWLIKLVPYLPRIAPISQRSVYLPYVAIGVVVVVFAARRFIYEMRYSWRDLAVSVLVCLMIVSNQFILVQVVGNGRQNIEFKLLADWYIANAKPGEKILSTMSNIMRIFAPEHKDSLLHTSGIGAENPDDFVKKCYDENITYVTWDSRIGLGVGGRYYKLWGIKNIAMLAEPRSIGPYEFITQIRAGERQFVNIFRLHKPSPHPATGWY